MDERDLALPWLVLGLGAVGWTLAAPFLSHVDSLSTFLLEGAVAIAIFAYVAVGALRRGVVIFDDALLVRTIFWRYRFSWQTIEGFELDNIAGDDDAPPALFLEMVLRGLQKRWRRTIRLPLGGGFLLRVDDAGRARRLRFQADQLNSELRRHTDRVGWVAMSEASGDSSCGDGSRWWVSLVETVGVWLLVGIVGGVVLLGAVYMFWHPDEVRRTSPLGSPTITFETKASWLMISFQGLGAVIGILVVAVATPLALRWIFCVRLGWPRVMMIPIVLLTVAATVTIGWWTGRARSTSGCPSAGPRT